MDGQTDRRTEMRWPRRAIALPAFARESAHALSDEIKIIDLG